MKSPSGCPLVAAPTVESRVMGGPQTALGVICLLALFGPLPAPVQAQTVRGLVLDATSNQPIPLATVTLISSESEPVASALTDDSGFFSVGTAEDGTFLVRAVALGYRPGRAGPVSISEGGLRVVELRLEAAPLGVEGLVVEGAPQGEVGNRLARRGFWERYSEGKGQFLLPGEVLASDAMFTPHLLRGLEHVVPQYGAAPWEIWPRFGISEASSCEPRVFVDNVWVNRPGFGIRGTWGLDDVVPIARIEAVEVYEGAFDAPIRYQGTSGCGVILIWTR